MKKTIVIFLLCVVLSTLLGYMEKMNPLLSEEGSLFRKEPGQGDYETELLLKIEDTEDEKNKRRYVRLQLMKMIDSELLNLKHLMEYGLKKAPQGAVKCIGDKLQLGEYISECFRLIK